MCYENQSDISSGYKIKVSVIVAVFNATELFLTKCIESLLIQTLKDIEIILVDDASTMQETLNALDKYKKHSNITILTHKVNKRGGGAWNTGMSVARGEFIGFVDQDDYVEKYMYQLLYHKAIKDGADIVIGGVQHVDDSGFKLGKRKVSKDIKFNTVVWDKIYKRSMIEKNNLSCIENSTIADWFTSLCMMYADKISKVDKVLYWYVKHNCSSVANQYSWIFEAMESENCFFKECKSRGLLEKYKDEVCYLYFYRYFWDGYKSILRYEVNSLEVLQKMLAFMASNGITIHDKAIKKNLNKKFWRQLWLLSYYPIFFRFFVFVKYYKHKKTQLIDCGKITQKINSCRE